MFLQKQVHNRIWYNGITHGLGPCNRGSIPLILTMSHNTDGLSAYKKGPKDRKTYEENYEKIFGKKKQEKPKDKPD
jgi:hypothetical protein